MILHLIRVSCSSLQDINLWKIVSTIINRENNSNSDYHQHAIYSKDSWLMAYQFQTSIWCICRFLFITTHISYVLWFLMNFSCCRKSRGFINCCIWQRPKQKPRTYRDHHWQIGSLKIYVFISFCPSLLLFFTLSMIWLLIVCPNYIVYYVLIYIDS